MKLLLKPILTIFFCSYLGLHAQTPSKYGFELIEYLKTVEGNEMVPLLIEGDAQQMQEVVQQYNGNIRLQVNNLFSVDIPASNVPSFANESVVKKVEFSTVPGVALSDTMLVHVNVDSIVQKHTPLRTEYTGKGVVMGVIDSGIELDHPDFKDSTGNTRVMFVWDQGVPFNPNRQALTYNYGVEWDSASIDNGTSTHDDKANEFGHGSNVTGAAASNGLASGQFRGVAPEVNIIAVATDFNKPNWLQTVAEAVDYIYKKADALGMPCVINASIGRYSGSHDGKDIAARIIDALIKQKAGRAFVCAAGNEGDRSFHVQQDITNDTAFTWFENNLSQWAGLGGFYYEVWSDTNDFSQLQFSIGADREANGVFSFRGRTNFSTIQNRLNTVYNDSILSPSGNKIADVMTFAEESQGRYKLEIAIVNPDSANYLYRFEIAGTGKVDIWSSFALFRHNDFRTGNLPSIAQFPPIQHYKSPDSLQTIVSSFTCLPSVITVGNYSNRGTYTDVSGTFRTTGRVPGEISFQSSLGPNRNNFLKPDVSSAGDFMFGSGRLATINAAINTEPAKVSSDSLHWRNGGTSMASPTVAGMVALYLQMCPKASNSQIKVDLIASTKRDQFTGPAISFNYGNGKADGFQFLKRNVFSPSINFILPNLCDGDSVQLNTPSNFNIIRWSTGDTSNSIIVKTDGDYYAFVENSMGCISPSDTATIQFDSIPNAPQIQQNGNTLSLNVSTGSFLWFLNGNPLNNQRSSTINALTSGNYFCQYTDGNGCSVNSDTVNLIVTSLNELVIEDDLQAFPNPADDYITIQTSTLLIKEIRLINTEGKIVLEKFMTTPKKLFRLDLSHIPSGIYSLRYKEATKWGTKKLIVE